MQTNKHGNNANLHNTCTTVHRTTVQRSTVRRATESTVCHTSIAQLTVVMAVAEKVKRSHETLIVDKKLEVVYILYKLVDKCVAFITNHGRGVVDF